MAVNALKEKIIMVIMVIIIIIVSMGIGFEIATIMDKNYYINNEDYQVWQVHETMKEHYNYCPYCGEELIDMLEAVEERSSSTEV